MSKNEAKMRQKDAKMRQKDDKMGQNRPKMIHNITKNGVPTGSDAVRDVGKLVLTKELDKVAKQLHTNMLAHSKTYVYSSRTSVRTRPE